MVSHLGVHQRNNIEENTKQEEIYKTDMLQQGLQKCLKEMFPLFSIIVTQNQNYFLFIFIYYIYIFT